MPFVKFITSAKLDADKRDAVRNAIWDAISIIPGKQPARTMVEICDEADLQLGPGGAPSIFMETRLYTRPPIDVKKEYSHVLAVKFQELLGIDASRMYFNVLEFNEWGSNGNYLSF